MSTIAKATKIDKGIKSTSLYHIKHYYIPKAGKIVYDDNNKKIGDGKTRYKDLKYVK